MEYRQLGRTGLQVSEIGLGALEIGRDWGIAVPGDSGRPGEEDAVKLVQAALDLGINFIDTAPAYQLSEERVGKALQGRRNGVYIATKVGEHFSEERGFWYDYSPEAIRTSVEQSLRRLRLDCVDLLQIHSASVEIIAQGEVLEAMRTLQSEGKARFLGMTGEPDACVAAISTGAYDTVQVPYSILDQRAASQVFPLAQQHNVGVIIMLPLAQGALSAKFEHLPQDSLRYEQVKELTFLVRPGQTLAQAALRFVLAHSAVSSVIAGTRKIENLRANVEAAQGCLTPPEMQRLERLTGCQVVS